MSAENPKLGPMPDPRWENVREYKKITLKIFQVKNAIMEAQRHLAELERVRQLTIGRDLPEESIISLDERILETKQLIEGLVQTREQLILEGKPLQEFFGPEN